jgi:hypothetical protein
MSKTIKNNQLARQERMAKLANLTNPPRVSQTEKDRLMTVFGTEPEIYLALRDCFFGFNLDDYQKQLLKNVLLVKDLIRKMFLPELKKEIPFGQNYDLWQTQDIKTASIDSFEVFYKAKWKILDMLETSLKRLENLDLEGVDLSVKRDDEDGQYPHILARNGYMSYVDQQIRFLMQYSISGNLSDEEIQNMLRMNSAK